MKITLSAHSLHVFPPTTIPLFFCPRSRKTLAACLPYWAENETESTSVRRHREHGHGKRQNAKIGMWCLIFINLLYVGGCERPATPKSHSRRMVKLPEPLAIAYITHSEPTMPVTERGWRPNARNNFEWYSRVTRLTFWLETKRTTLKMIYPKQR